MPSRDSAIGAGSSKSGGAGVQKGAVNQRSGHLIPGALVSAAVGKPGRGRGATQTAGTAAGISGFPLDLVVVEDDVEVPGAGRVLPVNQDQLEAVQFVGMAA